jgi:hypothetical protein
MKQITRTLGIVVAIVLMAGTLPVDAAKEMKGQVAHNFINNSGELAYGLSVKLSTKAIVVMEDNRAGPFGNVSGNNTTEFSFGNPTEPITLSEGVELTFRSTNPKLKITTWWWTDAKGKRLGKKQKG